MSITIQQAIDKISLSLNSSEINYNRTVSFGYFEAAEELKKYMEAEQMAIDALREKAEREDPKPLTLEELWQMEGEPVYIERIGWRIHHGMQVFMGEFHLHTGEHSSINISKNRVNIYRHKPKEVQE